MKCASKPAFPDELPYEKGLRRLADGPRVSMYPIFEDLVPKTILLMVFRTRDLKFWELAPFALGVFVNNF